MPAPEIETAATAPAASNEGYDPFAGDMPDLIADAHVRLLDGRELDLATLAALYELAIDQGDDARPWLLLARDSMARGGHGVAVRQYASALEADPGVADAPFVLASPREPSLASSLPKASRSRSSKRTAGVSPSSPPSTRGRSSCRFPKGSTA